MQIGFVGLGPMGEPMAMRLLEAGHALRVYNRTTSRADMLAQKGATRATTPAEAAQDSEVVFSMLANDGVAEPLTTGPEGVAAGLRDGAVHVSCSTISPTLSRRLEATHRDRGQLYAAATVLGRPPAAKSGELFIILAGSDEARARVAEPLGRLGQHVFDLGTDPGRSNLVKLALNFMILSTLEQMGEVFALCDKGGVAPAALFEIMTGSFFNAPVHRNYGQIMVEQSYDPPGVGVPLALKDTKLLLGAADELAVPTPLASLLRDRYLAMVANKEDKLDFAALAKRVRSDAGLR